MSKLSELSNRVVKASTLRAPELRLHPDAKSFNMRLPIIMKDVRKLFGDSSSNALEILNSDLIKIIKKTGDTQNRKTNVKADMTCLLYTSPSPRDRTRCRMPSSA